MLTGAAGMNRLQIDGALALTYVAAILPTVKVRAVADPDERIMPRSWRSACGNTPGAPSHGATARGRH
jgi:hypothetical protein